MCSVITLVFFFNDTATTEIYTLSLHDALPIFYFPGHVGLRFSPNALRPSLASSVIASSAIWKMPRKARSEEHTSELQSHLNLVCRLLLEKKNNGRKTPGANQSSSSNQSP